jgi:hypothetical protein|tara:strand:+ start:2335 stop:3294 length:960 start_codon:yes stop_codon:yes gene_type:complete
MAEDNPFLSFFESIGTGMEASQRRRTLMERAQRGEDVDVPGRFATVMSAIARAATPAETRLRQDQLRMQTANYALQNSIREKEYNLKVQNQILDNAELSAKLEQEINDNNGYRTAGEELQSLMNDGDIAAVRSYRAPEGMSLSGQQQVKKLKDELLAGKQAERIAEYRDIKAELMATYSFTEENVPKDYFTAKQELETLAGMRESKARLELGAELLAQPQATGVNLTIPNVGQVFLSNKKDDATESFRGMDDDEIQRRYLGLVEKSKTVTDEEERQAVESNLTWLREIADQRNLSLPAPLVSSLSLLDRYRNRKQRMNP